MQKGGIVEIDSKVVSDSKVLEILKSRKFWITIATMLMAISLFLFGQIDIDKTVEIIRWAAGLYVGGLSIEDGFKKLAPTVLELLKVNNTK